MQRIHETHTHYSGTGLALLILYNENEKGHKGIKIIQNERARQVEKWEEKS
jgi:hypothetical protein